MFTLKHLKTLQHVLLRYENHILEHTDQNTTEVKIQLNRY